MAVMVIPHKPALTKEQARAVFTRQFEGKYKVEDCESPLSLKTAFRDFQLHKNHFVGVAIKLEQTETQTKFVYAGVPPRRWTRLVFGGIICFFLANGMTKEVEDLIRTAPEFQ